MKQLRWIDKSRGICDPTSFCSDGVPAGWRDVTERDINNDRARSLFVRKRGRTDPFIISSCSKTSEISKSTLVGYQYIVRIDQDTFEESKLDYQDPSLCDAKQIPAGWRLATEKDKVGLIRSIFLRDKSCAGQWGKSLYDSVHDICYSNWFTHDYIVRIDEDPPNEPIAKAKENDAMLPEGHYCLVETEEDYQAFRKMFPGELNNWYGTALPEEYPFFDNAIGRCFYKKEGRLRGIRLDCLDKTYIRIVLPSQWQYADPRPLLKPGVFTSDPNFVVSAMNVYPVCKKYNPTFTINHSDLIGDPEMDKTQFKKLLQEVLQEEKIEAAPSKPGLIRRSSGFALGCAWKLVKYCMGPSKAWIQNLAFLASVCGIGYAGYNYGPPAYSWAKSWIPSVKVSFQESSPSESITRVD